MITKKISMNKIKILFCLISVTLLSNGFSQKLDPPFRIELNAPKDEYPYQIATLGDKGFILYYEAEILSKTTRKWRFVNYDAYFRKIWQKDIVLNRFLEPIKDYADSLMFGVTMKYNGPKEIVNPIIVYSIKLKDTSDYLFELPFDNKDIPNKLIVDTDRAFLTTYKNDKEDLYILKFADKKYEKIVFPNTNDSFIQFISKVENSTQLLVGLRNDNSRKENQISIFRISIDGIIVSQVDIPKNSDYFLNSSKIYQIGLDTFLIIGTYINKSDKPSGLFVSGNEVNTGIYSLLISSTYVLSEINYYNFARMKNIFRYLSSKDADRLRKKSNSNKITDPGYSLNLQLLLHNIKKMDSSYIFISEAYYPEYRTEENVNYDFYGRPFPNSRTIFEGYRYTNGIITGFDKTGKLNWDNNYPLNNMISFELSPRISSLSDSTNILLAYCNDGEIYTMAINKNDIIQNIERSKIDLLSSNEFAVSTNKSYIRYWYNNFFLMSGYQEIRGNSKSNKSKKNTFFITKMVYKLYE